MDVSNKKVLVCGMAKSGISAAEFLKNKGAFVTLQDLKQKENFPEAERLEDLGITLYTGKNPDDIVGEMDFLVLSPGIPCDLPFVKKAEALKIPVISEVELAYLFTPCPVLAITGTNGKTTTTTLLGEIMKEAYQNVAVVGNIGTPFSSKVESLDKDSFVVAEISSFQMETSYEFHPKVSAVLNITPDHLNRHKTLQTYIAMKEKVFKNQTKDDFLILNYEDETCRQMADKAKAKVIFFSSERKLDEGIYLSGKDIIVNFSGINEKVIGTDELQILGKHNYENVMAAVAMALCAGVSLDAIRKVLREFKGVEHRIEFVRTVDGVDYYNDSKGTNPEASMRAVWAMVKPTILIGGGMDKGSEFDDFIDTFGDKVKLLVLFGETAEKIKNTCLKKGFDKIIMTDSLKNAVDICRKNAADGDCVLLSPACASWDMFESYEQRGEMFKEMVNNL